MNICVVGGDLRNEYLYRELLKSGYAADRAALENGPAKNYGFAEYDLLIGPIPFTRDNVNLYTPLYDHSIRIQDFLSSIAPSAVLMSGTIPGDAALNFKHIDLTKNTYLYDKNIISTCEGITQIILNAVNYTIHGAEILITGYGKVGKSISDMLKKLHAHVSVYSANQEEAAEIASIYKQGNIRDISGYDIIVNTIPSIIFDSGNLPSLKENALLIDVASHPGGVDAGFASENKIPFVQVSGIPGKKAPLSAARIMKEIVLDYIEKAF